MRAFGSMGLIGVVLAVTACSSPVGNVRFANQDPVWRVNDQVDTPEAPEGRDFLRIWYAAETLFYHRAVRTFEWRDRPHALNINSLDEVPDSSWFTNRFRDREITTADIKNARSDGTSANDYKPWTILSSKVGGVSVGFIIKDTRGAVYLLKFDAKGLPEAETGTDVICQRLFHALGFNVPQDDIVTFTRKDLIVGKKAKTKVGGVKRKLTDADVDEALTKVNVSADGTIRGLTSKFLSGKPLGGYAAEGLRKDDPNDIIPHQHRRELRGQLPIFAWLNHSDIKEDNTLDMWVESKEQPGTHYVTHNLVDFGKAMGVLGLADHLRSDGYEFALDFSAMWVSLATLGSAKAYDGLRPPEGLVGAGLFDSEHYHPTDWKPRQPYYPLEVADRFDGFWGAKLMMNLTPAHIRAAVETAQFSNPKTTDYLTNVLIERQHITAKHYYSLVAPLDRFEATAKGDGMALCFDDLGLSQKIHTQPTRYRYAAFDVEGSEPLRSERTVDGTDDGKICLDLPLASGDEAYTIARIQMERNGFTGGPVVVHVAKSESGALRVVGLRRR